MSGDYWLADSEARVLGPVSLEVVRDLAVRGKLGDVRAVSRDGKAFVPLREAPELQAVLSSPPQAGENLKAQALATQQIRAWLESIRSRSSEDVFRVPKNGSREAWRAAFFGLVHRYVPSRLPPDATDELRLACEDAFLHLAERMVEIERNFAPPVRGTLLMDQPPPLPTEAKAPPSQQPTSSSAPATVSWRGGMVHVALRLSRGDARPFVADPESNWKSDCLFIQANDKVMVNTPAEVALSFEGHVTQLHASGRVVGVKSTHPLGFAIKLLGLDETQRTMIRTWVQRAGIR